MSDGVQELIDEAKRDQLAHDIKAAMTNAGLTIIEAFDALGVPESERTDLSVRVQSKEWLAHSHVTTTMARIVSPAGLPS